MYRFYLNGIKNEYHLEELAREFLANDEFEIIPVDFHEGFSPRLTDKSYLLNGEKDADLDGVKRELYRILSNLTGITPEWGTLTGVRPLKLAFSVYNRCGDIPQTMETMAQKYLLHPEKIELLRRILNYQLSYMERPETDSLSLYIHIPFCPTRCSYCSFASSVATSEEIAEYLEFLLREVEYTGAKFRKMGQSVESVYIGGGTPTTLEADQLSRLVDAIQSAFRLDLSRIEFTIEAGRPDTITRDKLEQIHEKGVDRISINPQSMNPQTLREIGREHSPEDIREAFRTAAAMGFRIINSDVIAGLPGETPEDFKSTLEELVSLGANNITVHTLSVKRGSKLKEQDPEYYRRDTENVRTMLKFSEEFLTAHGFEPYYIYRQKHQMGSFENVGYCKPEAHSVYNVRIMEEKQTIIGLGAGAIGKRYYPESDRLERIPNVGNSAIYKERFDEMLLRKNNYWEDRDGN